METKPTTKVPPFCEAFSITLLGGLQLTFSNRGALDLNHGNEHYQLPMTLDAANQLLDRFYPPPRQTARRSIDGPPPERVEHFVTVALRPILVSDFWSDHERMENLITSIFSFFKSISAEETDRFS